MLWGNLTCPPQLATHASQLGSLSPATTEPTRWTLEPTLHNKKPLGHNKRSSSAAMKTQCRQNKIKQKHTARDAGGWMSAEWQISKLQTVSPHRDITHKKSETV